MSTSEQNRSEQESKISNAELVKGLTGKAKKEAEKILRNARQAGHVRGYSINIDKSFTNADVQQLGAWNPSITVKTKFSTKNNPDFYDFKVFASLDFTHATQEQKNALTESAGSLRDRSADPRYENLSIVAGDLSLDGAQTIRPEQFPNLRVIKGDLYAHGASSIELGITNMEGRILTDSQKIRSAVFPELLTFGKEGEEKELIDGYMIERAHFPKVKEAYGNIRLANCRDWNFDSLEKMAGRLELTGRINDVSDTYIEHYIALRELEEGRKFSEEEKAQKRAAIIAEGKDKVARLPKLENVDNLMLSNARYVELPSLLRAGSLYVEEALKLVIGLQPGQAVEVGVLYLNGSDKSIELFDSEVQTANERILKKLQEQINSGKLIVGTIITNSGEAQDYNARQQKAA